uniref:Uncharacterized protein n=1 Tax=Anguilla anguilla TaxID=7936 RepID=A0A0E9QQ94_ANGAN
MVFLYMCICMDSLNFNSWLNDEFTHFIHHIFFVYFCSIFFLGN